jgi:tripartite-type tricarboxylate transporter receptor subunit TctC
MRLSHLRLRAIALGLPVAIACCAYAQQSFPNRPVRIITPNTAGGSSDVIARLLAHKLTEGWGQQVVVDNRPGGNG